MKSASHNGFGTVRGSRLARAPRHAGGGGVAATALAFLAALLLAPGEARAANECGTLSGTPPSATCTATTYANGINYLNAAGATVNVPGAATAWTVTSGSASNNAGSAIALVSNTTAGGTLTLTVGSATGNVNIRQRASTPNTGSDNNNGIKFHMQRSGASTTMVTVHSGSTIGTQSAPMNRHGIHVRLFNTGGAATITNAGTIHATEAGIYLDRGSGANTYFAGDATNTGAARIVNSGALTRTGGGAQGIDLRYQGYGAATITNSGAIDASAATGGGRASGSATSKPPPAAPPRSPTPPPSRRRATRSSSSTRAGGAPPRSPTRAPSPPRTPAAKASSCMTGESPPPPRPRWPR